MEFSVSLLCLSKPYQLYALIHETFKDFKCASEWHDLNVSTDC